MIQDWNVQGSAAQPYHVVRNDDEHMSCSCPAWTSGWKRTLGYRSCKHIDKIAAKEGLRLTRRGEHVFVTGTGTAAKTPTPVAMTNKKTGKTIAAMPPQTWAEKAAKRAARTVGGMVNVAAVMTREIEEAVSADFIPPMLASKMPSGHTVDWYANDKWVMEEKYDGHRMIVRVTDGKVQAWSRLGNRRTLPAHIVAPLEDIEIDVALDGELIVPGGKSYKVTDGASTGLETLVLFDIIEAMGKKVGYEQSARRKMLEVVYGSIKGKMIVLSKQMPPSQKFVDEIWARGGEGAIIKSRDGMYRPNVRTPDWVKVKKSESVVITVTGYEDGKAGPYSVTVGVDKNGVPIKVKTLDYAELQNAGPAMIGKRLVVTMQERTPDGKARHAMWDHWAADSEV